MHHEVNLQKENDCTKEGSNVLGIFHSDPKNSQTFPQKAKGKKIFQRVRANHLINAHEQSELIAFAPPQRR